MGGSTPPYARTAADISDSSASGRAVLTGTAAQGASALGVGTGNVPTFSGMTASGTFAGLPVTISVRNASSDAAVTTFAGVQLSTGQSSNVWQVFARNGALMFGIAAVSDLFTMTDTGAAVFAANVKPGTYTVASLPSGAAAVVGSAIYVSNARKVGEAAGSGTGVMAYYSNGAWRRFSDDTAVAA